MTEFQTEQIIKLLTRMDEQLRFTSERLLEINKVAVLAFKKPPRINTNLYIDGKKIENAITDLNI